MAARSCFRRGLAAPVVAVALVFAFAGCGSDEETTAPAVESSSANATTTTHSESASTETTTEQTNTSSSAGGVSPPAETTTSEAPDDNGGGGGGVSPGYDPSQPDSSTNDVPPEPGTPQQGYEQYCKDNPGACGD
jgi:cytoskeletal protein RodZ